MSPPRPLMLTARLGEARQVRGVAAQKGGRALMRCCIKESSLHGGEKQQAVLCHYLRADGSISRNDARRHSSGRDAIVCAEAPNSCCAARTPRRSRAISAADGFVSACSIRARCFAAQSPGAVIVRRLITTSEARNPGQRGLLSQDSHVHNDESAHASPSRSQQRAVVLASTSADLTLWYVLTHPQGL